MDLGGSICLASDRFRRGPYPLRKGIVGVRCKLRLALPMRQSIRLRICSVKMSMPPPKGDTLPRKDGACHLHPNLFEVPTELAAIAAVLLVDKSSGEFLSALAVSSDIIPKAPVGEGLRINVYAFDDVALRLISILRSLGSLLPLLPASGNHVAVFEDPKEGRIIFLPHPRDASSASVVVPEFGHDLSTNPTASG